MIAERFAFPNAGGDELAAVLDLPKDRRPRAYALFAHCFTCGKDFVAARRIAAALTTYGWGVLRFDFTGLGESEGELSGFGANVEDLLAAAAALRRSERAPSLLIGHSLGGAAVLAAAGRLPEVEAVVTVAAPADPTHVLRHIGGKEEELERKASAPSSSPVGRSGLRGTSCGRPPDRPCWNMCEPWMPPSSSFMPRRTTR
jgi:putative redox protein